MQTRLHRADETLVLVSRGPLLMYIFGPTQSTLADFEIMRDVGYALAEEFGALGSCVVFNHGTQPPPPLEIRQIVALANDLERFGPGAGVLMGLRPVTFAMFRAVIATARRLGFAIPVETQLEDAARYFAARLDAIAADDVMRLYEDGARRLLIRPGAVRSRRRFRIR